MRTLMISFLLLAAMFSSVQAADPACRSRNDLVGSCFSVRGSLQLYNGTPSARIRVMNSKRVLGVQDYVDVEKNNETFVAPENIRKVVSFDNEVRGRFIVCPLSKKTRGVMQYVCVQSGNLEK